MKKIVLKVLLGSVIAEVLLVCLFILLGSEVFSKNFDLVGKSMGSVGIIFLFSIPCLFYSKIYCKEEYRKLTLLGTVLALITAVMIILYIWGVVKYGTFYKEVYSTIIHSLDVMVWALAIISWLLCFETENNLVNKFKLGSIIMVGISSVLSILIILFTMPEGFLARLIIVIFVLTAGALICTAILKRIYKNEITLIQGE